MCNTDTPWHTFSPFLSALISFSSSTPIPLRLLMEKGAVSIGESCYLLIKHIGENSQGTCHLCKAFQVATLGGLIKLSTMFLENAMCQ